MGETVNTLSVCADDQYLGTYFQALAGGPANVRVTPQISCKGTK